MAKWQQVLEECQGGKCDAVRLKYLTALHQLSGRNVIAFYSGWLQKQALGIRTPDFFINDAQMTGFMNAIHELDQSKGLDLLLHTPGGEINATEALVEYLKGIFKGDIRAFVPHQAMSAGTMIALACREVYMGMHSSLGPVDPQINGSIPAHGIIEEFNEAKKAFKDNSIEAQAWVPILQKYTPTLLGQCNRAVEMSDKIVRGWLESGMFRKHTKANRDKRIKQVVEAFGTHTKTLNHARHFGYQKVKDSGVSVRRLEDDPALQDAVLSAHHAFTATFILSNATSIIQNHNGAAFVTQIPIPQAPQFMAGPIQIPFPAGGQPFPIPQMIPQHKKPEGPP